jgi:short-subunit dehydrogenase
MGVVHGIQTLVPKIKAHGEGGHVVNTSSIAGLLAIPTLGIYAATKYAVVALSEILRGELAPFNINVSVVCPSFVRTRLHEGDRNRPSELGGGPGAPDDLMATMVQAGTPPEIIGERVLRGVKRGDFYILPHSEMKLGIQARAEEILAAFDLD